MRSTDDLEELATHIQVAVGFMFIPLEQGDMELRKEVAQYLMDWLKKMGLVIGVDR